MGCNPNIYPQDGCKIEDPPTDDDISWFSGWGVLPVRKGIYFRHRSAFQRVLMAHLSVKSFGPFAQWLKHRLNRWSLVLPWGMASLEVGWSGGRLWMQGGVELMELVMSHMGGIIYSFKKMGPRCEVRLMQLFMCFHVDFGSFGDVFKVLYDIFTQCI